MEATPALLALLSFIVAVCGKLIWDIWSEARKEAKSKAGMVVENKVKIAVVEERVDGHEKRIDHLEDDDQRFRQTKK